jgi:two-component system, NtrC family, C4-dicarboxylate transport response regulator DctD
MSTPLILIDDDVDLLSAQTQALTFEGYSVSPFTTGVEALKALDPRFPGVVITDVRMPVMDGLEVFARVRTLDPELPVILMTGHGDVPMAVQALKAGAYDFLSKPFAQDDLLQSVRRALQTRELVLENRHLRESHARLSEPDNQSHLLGNSPTMAHLKSVVARVAEAEVDVLITGDTGVGKEKVARALHALSGRKNRPFVHISCAALDEDRFQEELFGNEQGLRPSAPRQIGRIEKAHKGTLFLDEVEGLTRLQQAQLLRVLETRDVWSVGADSPRHVDIRVIAASRIDLIEAVSDGRFRADLYYRLSGVFMRVPSLQERREDIPLLFHHFLLNAANRLNRPAPRLTLLAQSYLRQHDWPGNVRELEQFAERYALGIDDAGAATETQGLGLAEQVARFEETVLRETLERCDGRAGLAIEALRLPRKTFYDKINRYSIDLRTYRAKD